MNLSLVSFEKLGYFPTDEHLANFEKLATFLESDLVRKFDMSIMLADEEGGCLMPRQHACGTSACALGHATMVLETKDTDTWYDFERRNFGLDLIRSRRGSDQRHSAVWAWLFDADWWKVDNTPEGAAKRIRWTMKNKAIPSAFNFGDMLEGLEPLPYLNEDGNPSAT